jgi:putative addiction module component (TIGR02574 family)
MSTTEIFESARKLRPVERLQLIDALMDSLDEPDPAIEAAWAAEAQDRLAAYDRGELPSAPIEELLAKYRSQ